MYKNILFDLDGTLVNSEPGIALSLAYALSECGVEYDGDIKKFIGPPFKTSFPMFLNTNDVMTDRLISAYRVKYAEVGVYKTTLYRGIRGLLYALRQSGKKIALATTKPLRFAEIILKQKRIYKLFDFVAGTDTEGLITDKHDVLRLIFSISDFKRSETVLVGDTSYDIQGAAAASIDCVSVTYGYGNEKDLVTYGAQKIVRSVKNLSKILLG